MPSPLTLILPYYRQPLMLQRQLEELHQYPPEVQIIIVDDGSPEPAEAVVRAHARPALLGHLRLYCVLVDVPWNREMARNLGAQEAETEWIVELDLDHVLPMQCIPALLAFPADTARWYRFPRWRVGRADETRQKDGIAREAEFGAIHPHVDSYLVGRDVYWRAGGYSEDFCGMLGGGGEFQARLERTAGRALLLPSAPPTDIALYVYTRSRIADASDTHCSRDTASGKVLWREKQRQGLPKPTTWCRLPWERVL